MTIYADLIANAVSVDFDGPDFQSVGEHQTVKREINNLLSKGDLPYPTGFAAINEVQSIAEHDGTVSGGTFALTFNLKSEESFTTGNIVYEASAATIETAIDVAATSASIVGWTNGDVTVAGGHLNSAAVTFTFDGTSVAGLNHPVLTIDGTLLTGGGSAGAVTTSTEGQTKRTAYAILKALSIFPDATPPVQGTTLSAFTAGAVSARDSHVVGISTLRALAREAAINDEVEGNESVILTALKL